MRRQERQTDQLSVAVAWGCREVGMDELLTAFFWLLAPELGAVRRLKKEYGRRRSAESGRARGSAFREGEAT